MEINNNSNIRNLNFNGNKRGVTNPENKPHDGNRHEVQLSANNVLGNYGVAFVNMNNLSFRGNGIQNNNDDSSIEVRELTDEEFEEYKARLDEKIRNLPDEVQKKVKNINISKVNIFILDKVLSSEIFYNNDEFIELVKSTKPTITTIFGLTPDELENNKEMLLANAIKNKNSQTRARIQVMDEITSGEAKDSEPAKKYMTDIISNAESEPQANVACEIFSNDVFYNNEEFMKNAADVIAGVGYSEKKAEAILAVMKKISSDGPKDSEPVKKYMTDIVSNAKYESQANVACEILSNEIFYNNEEFMKNAADVIAGVGYSEKKRKQYWLL